MPKGVTIMCFHTYEKNEDIYFVYFAMSPPFSHCQVVVTCMKITKFTKFPKPR
jgi:hypothetical protein